MTGVEFFWGINAALGLSLILLGAARMLGSALPKCGGCGDPMPDGAEALEGGKAYCRACARRLGLRAWYAK